LLSVSQPLIHDATQLFGGGLVILVRGPGGRLGFLLRGQYFSGIVSGFFSLSFEGRGGGCFPPPLFSQKNLRVGLFPPATQGKGDYPQRIPLDHSVEAARGLPLAPKIYSESSSSVNTLRVRRSTQDASPLPVSLLFQLRLGLGEVLWVWKGSHETDNSIPLLTIAHPSTASMQVPKEVQIPSCALLTAATCSSGAFPTTLRLFRLERYV